MTHTVTIKRPSGEIETVLRDDKYMMRPEMFLKAYEATLAAGRGELISSTGAVTISGDVTETMTLDRAKAEIAQEKIDAEARKVRAAKAKAHDNLYNEGAEGYNPYYN